MKRLFVLGILGLFLVSMMAGVLAVKTGKEIGAEAGTAVRGVIGGGQSFVENAFQNVAFGDNEWLSKLFFAILLGMVIYTIISSFFSKSNSFIQWGITIAITSISFMGIPADFLEALRTSYGAMGLTILTVIPFLIMVIFTVKTKDLMIARGTWAFYGFYYFLLVIGKWLDIKEINKVGQTSVNIGIHTISTTPYWIAILGGIFMFFTIPYIRYFFDESGLDTYVEKAKVAIERNTATQKLAKESREGEVGAATS